MRAEQRLGGSRAEIEQALGSPPVDVFGVGHRQ